MLTFDLAEEFRQIACNALHPGTLLDTKMVRESEVSPRESANAGASAVVELLKESLISGITGRYYDGGRPAPSASPWATRTSPRERSVRA